MLHSCCSPTLQQHSGIPKRLSSLYTFKSGVKLGLKTWKSPISTTLNIQRQHYQQLTSNLSRYFLGKNCREEYVMNFVYSSHK